MTRLCAILLALFLAMPAAAAEDDDARRGLDLMSEGARLLLQELLDQMQPALDGLRQWLDDLSAYYPPEVLPNGDIIIRRRHPLQPEPEPEDEIEL